jgi:hypothetical protein
LRLRPLLPPLSRRRLPPLPLLLPHSCSPPLPPPTPACPKIPRSTWPATARSWRNSSERIRTMA